MGREATECENRKSLSTKSRGFACFGEKGAKGRGLVGEEGSGVLETAGSCVA